MGVMITIMLSHPRLMTLSNKSVYLNFKGQEAMNVEQTSREILEVIEPHIGPGINLWEALWALPQDDT